MEGGWFSRAWGELGFPEQNSSFLPSSLQASAVRDTNTATVSAVPPLTSVFSLTISIQENFTFNPRNV